MSEVEKTKQAKFSIHKEKFAEIIKAQVAFSAIHAACGSVLNGINFKMVDDLLTLVSTDGNRLLKNEVLITDEYKNTGFVPTTYAAGYLGKIKFIKGINLDKELSHLDVLEITLTSKHLQIYDKINKISYEIPAIEGKYPDYDSLIPQYEDEDKEVSKIGLNVAFFNDLKHMSVNERTNIMTLKIKSPLSAILAESEQPYEGIKSTTLLMPVQIR